MIEVSRLIFRYGSAFLIGTLVASTAPDLVFTKQVSPSVRGDALPPSPVEDSEATPSLPLDLGASESRCVGVIVPAERIDLVASGDGRLALMDVALGDLVNREQLLAAVEVEDLEYRKLAQTARLREAEVAIEKAALRVDLARRKWLRRQGHLEVFSEESLEQNELELATADLDLEAARARSTDVRSELALVNERLARRRIVAPFAGQITARYVDLGATVSAGQAILQLVPTSGRLIQFAVQADDAERYRLGRPVLVTLEGDENGTCARIDRVSPTLDQGSSFVFMAARSTEDRLRTLPFGTTVRVEIAEDSDCV